MNTVSEYCVVLTTFADDAVGKKIIDTLLEKHLAACIQVQAIDSFYHWEGAVNCDAEKQVLIKTREALYPQVEKIIRLLHDYDVPEIIKLPITGGSDAYLGWIRDTCPDI